MDYKQLKVKPETHQRLSVLKAEENLNSFDELLNELMENYGK
jgi:hypothetical protein